jgi:hypothetical protein
MQWKRNNGIHVYIIAITNFSLAIERVHIVPCIILVLWQSFCTDAFPTVYSKSVPETTRGIWTEEATSYQSESRSYITTDIQLASPSRCQAPISDPRPNFPILSSIIFLDSFGFVDVGRPLWRGVGSVLFSFCRASPVQPFSYQSHGTHILTAMLFVDQYMYTLLQNILQWRTVVYTCCIFWSSYCITICVHNKINSCF